MNLLPKTTENFSQKEYWDSFFKKRGKKAFEWYGEFPELVGYIVKYVKTDDEVLMVGCGNSTLSMDMFDTGYKKITNIDISTVAIKQMQKLNKDKRSDLKYLVMDALYMIFENEKFSVAFDKGTLDALLSDNSPEALERADRLFTEVIRVTKPNGSYVCVSLLQEHILRKLLEFFTNNKCNIRIERCLEPEQKAVDNGEVAMPVFMIQCSKTKKKKTILEFVFKEEISKIQNIETMITTITSIQQASQIISGLNRSNISDHEEVFFELYKPGNDSEPRYTIYVLDLPFKRKSAQYAAFIVPQGREAEWLFSTKAGRKKLLESVAHNRLAIVTMHRAHKYTDLEQVKEELNEHIRNLAPSSLKTRINYLSLGNEVGQREIKYKGNSDISGPFVVEDIVGKNNETYRRLIFLGSQNIIQSEVKLKSVKSGRRGKHKLIADPSYIACSHHKYMSLGTHLVSLEDQSTVAVIGLGGGGLCTVLQQFLPNSIITAIDIDPAMLKVAMDWFGLVQNKQLQIKIQDGLQFIEESIKNDVKYNAILFDVDSKDTSLGMSCPPKEFLSLDVLENVKNCLKDEGMFILNLVLRDEKLRPDVIRSLKSKYKTIVSYKLDEDLNEIIYCMVQPTPKEQFLQKYISSVLSINKLSQSKQIQNDEVEIKEMMDSLNINNLTFV